MSELLTLCQRLIQRPSVTPEDGGCQDLIIERLKQLGFRCDDYSKEDTRNCMISHGEGTPHIALAGHTDVVPTGDIKRWDAPPFAALLQGDRLIGRGACDMKGALAAMVVCLENLVKAHPKHPGTLSLVLTSDEEGPGTFGSAYMVEQLKAQGVHFDYCLVGEPTSDQIIGDTVKVGRRGSLHGHLTLMGRQGHIAYPEQANNPIHHGLSIIQKMLEIPCHAGDQRWPKTSLQISNISAGTGVLNVTPQQLEIDFNLRFSPKQSIQAFKTNTLRVLKDSKYPFKLTWALGAKPYENEAPTLCKIAQQQLADRLKQPVVISVSGGTSDARFLCDISDEVMEFGLKNHSAHHINEHILVSELEQLCLDYQGIVKTLLDDASLESNKKGSAVLSDAVHVCR